MKYGIFRFLLLGLSSVLPACAAGAPMDESGGAPAPARERADPSSVVVSVDAGSRAIGAWELEFRYDPAVVSVRAVRPAPEGGFPAAPMSDPSTWRSGATPILGFVVGNAPSGRVDVAVVELEGRQAGESSLSVSVRALYAPDGKPIPGTALGSAARVRVR
jgi:hypothetical protein